jgi:AcrR family transcriptional regulator
MMAFSQHDETDRLTSLPAVLEAGLRLIDEHGLRALSMRRLANELGIGAMTVYTYVRTKQELLDGIADMVLNQLTPGQPDDGTWQENLRSVVTSLHDALRAHPGVIEIVATRGVPIPALDQFRERLLAIFHRAGFDNQRAVELVSVFSIYATGFAQMERARTDLVPDVEAARMRGLRRDQFPNLSESGDAYATHISEHAFIVGLTSLIKGLD